MAAISVGDAVGAGFGLIRRQPLSVLAWGFVQMAAVVAVIALLAPFMVGIFTAAAEQVRTGVRPNPGAMMGQMMAMQGLNLLVNLGLILMRSVMVAAVARAVIHPEQSRFAYLRIGAPELFIFLLLMGASFVAGIAIIIPAMPFVIIAVAFAVAHQVVAAVITGIIGVIVLIGALLYLLVRLSMIAPMMVADGKFHFGESWTLTRGHVGSLFLVGFLVFLLMLVLEVVLGVVLGAIGFGVVSAMGGPEQILQHFKADPKAAFMSFAPYLVVLGVLWIPISGFVQAITVAPWARVFQQLTHSETVQTFA